MPVLMEPPLTITLLAEGASGIRLQRAVTLGSGRRILVEPGCPAPFHTMFSPTNAESGAQHREGASSATPHKCPRERRTFLFPSERPCPSRPALSGPDATKKPRRERRSTHPSRCGAGKEPKDRGPSREINADIAFSEKNAWTVELVSLKESRAANRAVRLSSAIPA